MKRSFKINYTYLSSLLFVILSFYFSSCQQNSAQKNTLRINISTEPPTLDPRIAYDLTSYNVLKMLFEGLVRDGDQGVEPALAESYSISEDGKTYTFYLREANWSNGDSIVADDFVYTLRWMVSPQNPSPNAIFFYPIVNALLAKKGEVDLSSVGITAIDKKTLVIQLEKPIPYFLDLLTFFFPVNHKIDQQNPKWSANVETYVSTGPFILNQWKHHDQLEVVKNPLYWDVDAVKLAKVHMIMVNSLDTELSMFENGDLDWAGRPLSPGLPPDSLSSLRTSGQLKNNRWAANMFLTVNTTKYPFNNANIRKAFAYAINRNELNTHLFQEQEEPALSILPPQMQLTSTPYFNDGDVETAKRYFKKGLVELNIPKAQFPKVTLIFNTTEIQLKLAQAIQEQWRKALGVNVELKHYEWKVYLDEVDKKEFQIARFGIQAGYNDPMTFLEVFAELTHPLNRTNWHDKIYTKLIDSSFYQKPAERKETLTEAEKILMDEMPIIPLFFSGMTYLQNPRLEGIRFSPVGLIDVSRSYFKEQP